MKTITTITDITHDDLVELLCTATYGSTWLDVWYNKDYYMQNMYDDKDCLEDRWARMLLNGQTIVVQDHYADKNETYGHSQYCYWDKEKEVMCFPIDITIIKYGLGRIIDGLVKCNDEEKYWLKKAVLNLMHSEEGVFDLPQADAIMQAIMFDEIVYE